MLIEAKHHNEILNNHRGQLSKYFSSDSVCKCADKGKIAVITNGVKYEFSLI